MDSPEIREFILGFIFAIIGVIFGVKLLGPLASATAGLPTEYAWLGDLIFLVAIFGVALFALKAFKVI
jgi:hypothetical protein